MGTSETAVMRVMGASRSTLGTIILSYSRTICGLLCVRGQNGGWESRQREANAEAGEIVARGNRGGGD